MGFLVNTEYKHKHNVIFNKTNQTCHYFDKMLFFHIWTLHATLTGLRPMFTVWITSAFQQSNICSMWTLKAQGWCADFIPSQQWTHQKKIPWRHSNALFKTFHVTDLFLHPNVKIRKLEVFCFHWEVSGGWWWWWGRGGGGRRGVERDQWLELS